MDVVKVAGAPDGVSGAIVAGGENVPVVVVSGFEDRDYGVRARRLLGLDQPGIAGCFFIDDAAMRSVHRAVCGVRLDELLAALPQPGRLPPTFAAWVAARVALLQRQVNREERRVAFAASDVIVAWDGAVWLCPRPVRSAAVAPWLAMANPPEVARGQRASAASDVHTVGAVLYTLLAEEGPWPGRTHIEVLEAVAMTTPKPLPPSTWAPLAEACLRPEARDRPDLMRVLAGLGRQNDVDERSYCCGLLAELFADRRRQELEWLEQLALVTL